MTKMMQSFINDISEGIKKELYSRTKIDEQLLSARNKQRTLSITKNIVSFAIIRTIANIAWVM